LTGRPLQYLLNCKVFVLILVNNTNLYPVSHRCHVIGAYWSSYHLWQRGGGCLYWTLFGV